MRTNLVALLLRLRLLSPLDSPRFFALPDEPFPALRSCTFLFLAAVLFAAFAILARAALSGSTTASSAFALLLASRRDAIRALVAACAREKSSPRIAPRKTSSVSSAIALCSGATPTTASSAHSTDGSSSGGAIVGCLSNPSSPSDAASAAVHRSAAALDAPIPPAPTLPTRRKSHGSGGLASTASSSVVVVVFFFFSFAAAVWAAAFRSFSSSSSSSASKASSSSSSFSSSFSAIGRRVCSSTTAANVRFFTVCSASFSSTSTARAPTPCSSTATHARAIVSRFTGYAYSAASSECEPSRRLASAAAIAAPLTARYRPITRAAACCTHW
eukprot:29579-Pelagococcus_subviridis.AAC.10